MITASINLTLLDKTKFIKGKKGTYVDLVLIETPQSEYGDYLIKQGLNKEDRSKNPDMPILGNAKVRQKKNGGRPAPRRKPEPEDDDSGDTEYDF